MKPTLIERLKYTYQFYRHGFGFLTKKKSEWPYIWPAWKTNVPQWHISDYQSLINDGFNRNSILYSAAMYKYYAFKAVPLRAYKGTFDEPELLPADHPLQKLCLRPNRFQSGPTFQGMADIFCNIAGTCYIYIKRLGDMPVSMHLLRPDRVYIIPLTSGPDPIGYYYIPEGKGLNEGIPYQAKDIMCVRMPNPGDDIDGLGEGLAPASVAAKSINVDNMITDFLQLFFQNGAMPPGYFSYDVPMQPEEIKEARTKLMEIYGGYEEWSKVAVLDSGGKYTRVGLTFAEMDMSKLDGRNQSLIVSPFGVPLTLLTSRAELTQSTYNNKEADRKMFWQDRMWSESKEFEAEYQYYLQGPRGEFVMFDFAQVPALTMTAQEKGEQARQAFVSGGILRNEYRAAIGQDPADDGDVYLLSSTIVEVPYRTKAELEAEKREAETMPELPPPPAPPPAPEEGQEGMPESEEEATETGVKSAKMSTMNLEQKAAFWTKADRLARDYEDDFGKAAVKAFGEDERTILALLNKGKQRALELKASPDWVKFGAAAAGYLLSKDNSTWKDAFIAPMTALATDKVEQLNDEFNQTYPSAKLLKQKWFNEHLIKFAQPINETTNSVINQMVEQAVDEGWTIDQMKNRLEVMFQRWTMGTIPTDEFAWYQAREPGYRRENIARTETMSALNNTSLNLYDAWGAHKKEWLTTMDGRQREDHADVNGTVIGIKEKFNVGGYEMDGPHDMSAPAKELCNCRCTLLPAGI